MITQETGPDSRPKTETIEEKVHRLDKGIFRDDEEKLLDVLVLLEKVLHPKDYPLSKHYGLETIDYFDIAECRADQFGLKEEFKKWKEVVITWETEQVEKLKTL